MMVRPRYQLLKYDGMLLSVISLLLAIWIPVGSLAWLSPTTTTTSAWHKRHYYHMGDHIAESITITATTRLAMSPQYQSGSAATSTTTTTTTTTTTNNNNRIIACSSTKELSQAVSKYVQSHHRVAELGSQLREVSTAICESATNGQVILVDVQRKVPKAVIESQARTDAMRLDTNVTNFYPDIAEFVEIPQLNAWPQAFFDRRRRRRQHDSDDDDDDGFDVLVLDVNAIVGNDLEWTSLALIQQFESINNKKYNNKNNLLVLVKSVGLTQFASRLVHGVRWKGTEAHRKVISPPHIVATVGVKEYRNTIPYTVHNSSSSSLSSRNNNVDEDDDDDIVLEVGCHFGTTTAILKKYTTHVLGVDVGSKIIKQAQLKYPDIPFRVGDAWKTAQLLRLQQECMFCLEGNDNDHNGNNNNKKTPRRTIGFDVVYVDVGGLSGADGLLEAINLISSIRHALEPRTIVIKSLCMQRLSSKLVPFWQLLKREQEEENERSE